MTATELHRIIMLTAEEYAAELAALEAAERKAYYVYCAGTRRPAFPPGSVQSAGHGSWVCDLNVGGVQDRWMAAWDRLKAFEAVRESGNWTMTTRGEDRVYYYRPLHHDIAVDTHGVDVSGLPIWEAIETVRGAIAA